MRARSPIEMMVDQACGLTPEDLKPTPRVTLRCPGCGKTKDAALDPTDPPNCATVVTSCPECARGGKGLVDYFDAKGRQIDLDGKPMRPTSTRSKETR